MDNLSNEKMLRYAIYIVGLFSIAAVLCFLVYISKYAEKSSRYHDLHEIFIRDQFNNSPSQQLSDDATEAAINRSRSKASKSGAELALLSFIALNVVYYVHFK